jgi:hypothetical protein
MPEIWIQKAFANANTGLQYLRLIPTASMIQSSIGLLVDKVRQMRGIVIQTKLQGNIAYPVDQLHLETSTSGSKTQAVASFYKVNMAFCWIGDKLDCG